MAEEEADPNIITLDHLSPVLAAMAFVPYPSGSYIVYPDTKVLFLEGILEQAMNSCGLGEHFVRVYLALWEQQRPEFQREVDRLEGIRLRLKEKFPDA